MTKLYHKVARQPVHTDPEELLARIGAFVGSCRTPAVLEFGEQVFPLKQGEYSLEIRSGRPWIDVWDENRNLSRRILTLESCSSGALDCTVHRFGGVPGKLSFLDLDRPQTAHKILAGSRQNFGEQFRRMIFRQFPGWEVETLSASMDLQRSFSPVFPRARLRKGSQQIAAIACPSPQDEANLFTFALIWFDYVQARDRDRDVATRLCLFLPEQAGCLTAHRMRWLNAAKLNPSIFRFNAHGSAGEVDPQDLGNLETRVSPRFVPPVLSVQVSALLQRLASVNGIGIGPELCGAISVRSRGVEFARFENGRVYLGIECKQELGPDDLAQVEEFAVHLTELNISPSPPVGASERWLESVVRSNLNVIDPLLLATPVHGQVLSFAGLDRDLIDLLAAAPSGRLTTLELKTVEDIHLPVQALDYWMRVMWHAQREELGHLFPGIRLTAAPAPRLLLVAPAIAFHSTNATVLRHFSREIDVERIGINSDWETEFKVVLRLKGANVPQSHRSSNGHAEYSSH